MPSEFVYSETDVVLHVLFRFIHVFFFTECSEIY